MFKTKTNLSYFVSFAKSDWSRNVGSSFKLPVQGLLLSLRGEPEFSSLSWQLKDNVNRSPHVPSGPSELTSPSRTVEHMDHFCVDRGLSIAPQNRLEPSASVIRGQSSQRNQPKCKTLAIWWLTHYNRGRFPKSFTNNKIYHRKYTAIPEHSSSVLFSYIVNHRITCLTRTAGRRRC